jgi:predicted PurR-regulated permease PerM
LNSESKNESNEKSTSPAEAEGETSAEGGGPSKPSLQAQEILANLPTLSRIISVIMLLIGILVVGLLFYKVMVGFFIPLFMAAALVVIFRPVNELFLKQLRGQRSVAAIATTCVILASVLLPVALLIFVSIGQLTSLVSRTDLNDVKAAIERGRAQLGLNLEHADRFRRLDDLAGMLNAVDQPDLVLEQITEAKQLLRFLDREVSGASPTGESNEIALERLAEFQQVVQQLDENDRSDEASDRIAVEERFHRGSVVASAAIHSWIGAKLGGAFRTQVKLLVNPSEKDVANSVRDLREYLQPRFVKLTGDTGKVIAETLIGLLIMVIATYFFFVDGPGMVRTLMHLSPLDDEYELRLLKEFENTSRAVVLASVCSAFAQGVLAAIAYYFCGLQSVVLLFLLTTVMALIPFLGAASIWVPCAIYIGAVEQRYGAAIFLVIYGAALVSTIDNVIKAYVLHGHSQLHPLIALLSVIGGVPVFGPIGILIGPMVVVFLQTLLEILNHEMAARDWKQFAPPATSKPTT